jgi:hypothetical protein
LNFASITSWTMSTSALISEGVRTPFIMSIFTSGILGDGKLLLGCEGMTFFVERRGGRVGRVDSILFVSDLGHDVFGMWIHFVHALKLKSGKTNQQWDCLETYDNKSLEF